MDVFGLRDDLVGAYRDYATSFMRFRDDRVRDKVDEALDSGRLWPHPSVGLNPSFEQGRTVGELVKEGVLHANAEPVFRLDKDETDGVGRKLPLYLHQEQAVRVAAFGPELRFDYGHGVGQELGVHHPDR